ncbi:hypothetical protein ACEN9F_27465 [Duganella sp. CT11-25]|jgi:hypothetical protein|uniref:hypothetical protein n=1 Tax=unclassified Duganella TaxID=2636909 RepID=UPI0039B043C0
MSTRAHKHRRGGSRRQRGAALLVLLTMLMLGVAALAINAFRGGGAREAQALQSLGQAREALLGYAALHGRLPRPSASPSAGIENPAPCASEQQCTGFLPWATLGLGPTYARGKPLRYSVTPAFSAPDARLNSALPSKTVATRRGDRLLAVRGRAPCSPVDECVPAVLIASGKYQGTRGADQAANDGATSHFIQRPLSDLEQGPGGAFDDLVAWVPYDVLIKRSSAAGSIR